VRRRSGAHWLVIGAAIAALSLGAAHEPEGRPGVELRLIGENWDSLSASATDAVWFALESDGSGARLSRVKLNADPIPSPSNRRYVLHTTPKTSPRFVIRGVPGLRAGAVEQWFSGLTVLVPGSVIQVGGKWEVNTYRALWASGKPAAAKDRGNFSFVDYQLQLWDGRSKVKQTLISANRAAFGAQVLWIGDIDRDALPDFFLNIETREAVGSTYALLLSSLARKGELAGWAAVLRDGAC
jgi:hypothetical protein